MFSFIIPFHIGLDYLEDCLESLNNQTKKDFQVLIVLDNAEDVAELVSKYSNINIKTINANRSGVAAARNIGIEEADMPYVYFLDSDDYLKEDAVEKLLNVASGEDVISSRIIHSWYQRAAFNMDQGDSSIEVHPKYGAKKIKDSEDYYNLPLAKICAKHKDVEMVTALGKAYKTSFLKENEIKFDENNIYYSDLEFVYKVEEKCKTKSGDINSVYVKRYHNDSINLPALSQIKDENRKYDLLDAFKNALKVADNKDNIDSIYKLIYGYFIKTYYENVNNNIENNDIKFITEIFNLLKNSSDDIINSFYKDDKKIAKALKAGNIKKLRKACKRKFLKKRFNLVTHKRMELYNAINNCFLSHLKLKNNWIVFESFMGRNYSGQPKYIYEYLQKNYGNEYKYIWMVDNKKLEIPGKCKKVKRLGLVYLYYMTRSKYWVTNMRQPHGFPKRKEQILLATWHGTPLKKLVFDMKDVHAVNPKYKEVVYDQTRDWDYLLSDNPFSTKVFESCFMFDKEKILEYGYPANDPLYDENMDERAKELKKKMGIPLDKKVLLYAPTWRDDDSYGAGKYKFNLALDLKMLKEKLGDEYVVLLRMHYWIVDQLDLTGVEDFVVNVSSYSDIADIYVVSDICMTDYSSVFFDYANLKRPILFYMYDLDKYRDVLRGFYLDVDNELPGPILTTNKQVLDSLINIENVKDEYKEKYNNFYNKFCCIDDGNASKRVVEKVFNKGAL